MKILYAVQGTGNGHITRAIEIIPHLQKRGDVDVLVSGIQSDIELPFKVKYRFNGLSFIFGKKGGVDVWRTYLKLNSVKLMKEIKSLDVKKYDLIISDFEPISCWAAYRAKKPCIGLSNQAATLHPLAPKPKHTDLFGKLVLQNYAPTTYNYGFHFKSLDKNVFTPIIRKEVREYTPTNKGHYTVYLPSYGDEKIIKFFKKFPDTEWQVFSKHSKKKYSEKNAQIIGVSADSVDSHAKFCDAEKLKFPLLADVDGKVSKAYGSWLSGMSLRHTYLIDPQGILRERFLGVRPAIHSSEVLAHLDELG